jgi:short-subunit dehydrogenase
MNKLAVITGATGGIGEALADALAREGYSLLLTGRRGDKLLSLKQSLSDKFNTRVYTEVADLTKAAERNALVALMVSKAESLELLVNNAGLSQFGLFPETKPQVIEELIQANIAAPMCLTQALLEQLASEPKKSLQIINIGSTFGVIGYPGFTSYSATKFALRGFSQALARELGDTDIRVRYFAPRATKTGLNSDAVNALNLEIGVAVDSPEVVAEKFIAFLKTKKLTEHIGWPERFFVWLNKRNPSLVGSTLVKQLPIIRRYVQSAATD